MGKKKHKKEFAAGSGDTINGDQVPANKGKLVRDEIAGVGTDIFMTWLGSTLKNPDYVLERESSGESYLLYDKMLDKDPHLFAVVQQRKLGVLSKPWQILAGTDEARDQEIQEFVTSVFDNIKYFDRDLAELLEAVPKGFAVSEVMWDIRSDGKIIIKELRNRDQRRFTFDKETALPRLKTPANRLYGEPVPPRKFLVHTYSPKFESPYGEGVLKKCYWYHWFKKNAIRFWAVFAEKFGGPTVVGKYPPGTEKSKQDELLEIIRTIQQETGVVIPDNLAIELLEQQRKSSTDTYQAFADYMDSQMSQAVVGQTLSSSEGQHGTQALGSVHEGVRQDFIEADCNSIMPVINELITWLVDWNYPNVELYPYFKIAYESPGDLRALAYRDRVLFRELLIPIALDYFYDAYGIPRPEEGQELLELPMELTGGGGGGATPGGGGGGEFAAGRRSGDTNQERFFAFAQNDKGEERYLRDTEELLANAMERAADEYEELTGQALGPVLKKKDDEVVTEAMLRQVEKLKLKPKPLGELLGDTLFVADIMARRHFEEEHEDVLTGAFAARAQRFGYSPDSTRRKDRRRKSGTVPFASRFAGSLSWEPKAWQEALEYLLGLRPMSASEAKKLDRALRRYSLSIADIESTRILDLVKAALVDAIGSGITVGEFKRRMNALFDSEGLSRLSRHHIENVFHTNLHSAYSAGNWQALHDPDIEKYFPFFQYLTAGDESVRPAHKAMHRFTARRDDPVWSKWWPPNGYRCRCRVVAVDKYTAERRHIEPSFYPGFEPDEGFEGTPMQQLGLAA